MSEPYKLSWNEKKDQYSINFSQEVSERMVLYSSREQYDVLDSLVENVVRIIISDRIRQLPQLEESKVEITVYKGTQNQDERQTRINFSLTYDCISPYNGYMVNLVSAKVFLADRNEYEPDLFTMLPTKKIEESDIFF